MSHPHPSDSPHSDRDLVGFLKQHRPQVPDAPAALEDRLMVRIERTEEQAVEVRHASRRTRSRRTQRRLAWLVPAGLAAAAIASWVIVRPAPQLAEAELVELEDAWISSWQVATEGIADSEDDAIALFEFDDVGDL